MPSYNFTESYRLNSKIFKKQELAFDILQCLGRKDRWMVAVEIGSCLLDSGRHDDLDNFIGIGKMLLHLSKDGYCTRRYRIGELWEYKITVMGKDAVATFRNGSSPAVSPVAVPSIKKPDDVTQVFEQLKLDLPPEDRMVPLFLVRESVLREVLVGLARNGVHVYDDQSAALRIRVGYLEQELGAAVDLASDLETQMNKIKTRLPESVLVALLSE